MNQNSIKNAVEAALVADCYLLGAHWIYDLEELRNLPIDWNELNAPCAQWHKGKEKGDFTHYGEHMKWLLDFVKDKNSFDISEYRSVWLHNMKSFTGYIDGATKETLEIMQKDVEATTGAHSHDLAIVGQITPLLYASKSKEEFLQNVNSFVAFTHNDERVLQVAKLFATILFDVANGSTIAKALDSVVVEASLQEAFDLGVASKGKDSTQTIQTFGPACPVEGCFEGTLHLLVSYDNFKEAMIASARAGGDSSARGMIVGMIMGAANYEIPSSWKIGTKGL